MENGVYLASLGISLADWLVGIGCESCLSLFNHYGVFTIAQLFCRDISYNGLVAVRTGPFGHNMTILQNQLIAAAAEGVYSVFEALAHIVNKVSSEDWESCADVHLTSIEREDADGFSDRSIPRMLVALIDRTCQQGMQVIIHSSLRLGIFTTADIMKSKEVIHASGSGNSDMQPDVSNNLEYRTITNANGRSRTVTEGYPTTANLFEFSSDSDHPPQTTAEPKKANQNLASPDKHDLPTDLQELKARYAFTFGTLPRGPKSNVASWLSGQIQAAQYHVTAAFHLSLLNASLFSARLLFSL
jgi:hypothetical protein